MKKKILAVLLGITMTLGLAGCGTSSGSTVSASPQETVSQASGSEGTAMETSAPEAASGQETPSREEQAALSGKVVVYCPSPAGLADKMAEAFTAKTGVQVEMFQGTTGEILARLEAEKANPIADVVIMASWADGLGMIQDDQVLSYEPANADKMNPDWIDADKKIYGYSASAVGVIYNTTQIDQLDADWAELGSDPAYKDLISIPDPVKSGACKDFLSGYSYAFGEEARSVIDSWVANGLTNPGANKAALEAVTTGEKAILIAGVDYNAYSSMDKGEPLSIYYPASGTVINPRPAMILKTSQNTDNAKAFMDFLLSDEGQQLVCDAYLLPGRTDITTDKRTNAADIPTFDLDWSWMMENSARIAEDLVNSCK